MAGRISKGVEFTIFITLLRHNSNLRVLDLSNTSLCGLDSFGQGTYDTRGVSKLKLALLGSSAGCLESLNLSGNFMDPQAAGILAEPLTGCHRLRSLNLSNNQIGNTALTDRMHTLVSVKNDGDCFVDKVISELSSLHRC